MSEFVGTNLMSVYSVVIVVYSVMMLSELQHSLRSSECFSFKFFNIFFDVHSLQFPAFDKFVLCQDDM